jgi:hypothetical protein
VPGLLAFGLGVVVGLFLTFEKVFAGAAIGNRPLLLLAVLLVVIGVQFFGLGLLGELLAHGAQPIGQDGQPAGPLAAVDRLPLRESVGVTEERLGPQDSGG